MALGPTHYRWRDDVGKLAREVRMVFPGTTVNTYVGHPWPGWDARSFDVWGAGGRGTPIDLRTGHEVKAFLRDYAGWPNIRHHIYLHELWTSFGGYSYWQADDHSFGLRHLHVTYW